MEPLIIIGTIVFLIIFLLAQDSNKETKRERYGDAVGKFANMTADTIGGIAHSIAEPADKKEYRLAKEKIASKNGYLYRYRYYRKDESTDSLLDVDDYFRKALNTVGLSEEQWKRVGRKLYYLGAIRKLSREQSDYSKKNPEYIRKTIIYECPQDGYDDNALILREALSYFNMDIEEWIKYGDTVIEMHNLEQDRDIEEHGYYVQIMPMQNNFHLI